MTAKQSSREEMTGCLDDSEIDPEMISSCAPLHSCLSLSLLSPWFFRGPWVTRCRASSKLQGRHLNLKCDTLEIENLFVYASVHCWHCNASHCSEFCLLHILESPGIVCRGNRSHAVGTQRPKTAFGIRLCALNC